MAHWAAAAGAAAFKRSRGRDPEWEHVPTGVPHSATRTGASENGVGVPARPTTTPTTSRPAAPRPTVPETTPTPATPTPAPAAPATAGDAVAETVTEERVDEAPGHEVLIDETSTESSTDRT